MSVNSEQQDRLKAQLGRWVVVSTSRSDLCRGLQRLHLLQLCGFFFFFFRATKKLRCEGGLGRGWGRSWRRRSHGHQLLQQLPSAPRSRFLMTPAFAGIFSLFSPLAFFFFSLLILQVDAEFYGRGGSQVWVKRKG